MEPTANRHKGAAGQPPESTPRPPVGQALTYVLITPARNEAALIETDHQVRGGADGQAVEVGDCQRRVNRRDR